MANALPPVPYKVPVVNDRGYMNEAWAKFFREVFSRIGGTTGDFSDQISEALEDYIDSENAAILEQIENVNKGPVL